jgi:tetratricopeptide (TPR) repeat protein
VPNRDWFRKESWSEADKADFFNRLRRAKPWNKSQYLLIQAGHLRRLGTEAECRAALDLIDLFFSQYPEQLFKAPAYLARAECEIQIGRHIEALESFRQAFDMERSFPNSKTMASLSFALFVVRTGRTELFEEAIEVLDELWKSMFPIHEYQENAIRAIVAEHQGDHDRARHYAQKALNAASRTESIFRNHKKLGLVDLGAELEPSYLEVQKLAGKAPG